MEFQYFNSKDLSTGKTYNLLDPVERLKYFHDKSGDKIEKLKAYLDNNTFIGYLLAKKQAGKGLYSKMVEEILGPDRFAHISVGDVIREAHQLAESPAGRTQLKEELTTDYRGFMTIDDSIEALLNRTQDKVSVPTEFLLTLLKRKIKTLGKKALFIDGLPRTSDQISYSLFFRDLINFRDDPDFFVMIEIPLEMIDLRMKGRVICPICHTSRNTLFSPTTFVKYDVNTHDYYFLCDNKLCSGYGKERFVSKEGDAAGVSSIMDRINQDQELIDRALKLQGIPKVLVRSSYPLTVAKEYLEDYEIQPIYSYEGGEPVSGVETEIKLVAKPWVFKSDSGEDCCTVFGAVYVLNLINQIYDVVIGNK